MTACIYVNSYMIPDNSIGYSKNIIVDIRVFTNYTNIWRVIFIKINCIVIDVIILRSNFISGPRKVRNPNSTPVKTSNSIIDTYIKSISRIDILPNISQNPPSDSSL